MEKQQTSEKSRRGFAIMKPERQLSSQGGNTGSQKGVAHERSKDEARETGRKSGTASGHRRLNRTENDGRDDIL
ncbi:general stress protein [Flavisolibacter nicotianae]|uniref:general stress protein n=1 Tax=Flavisolibacter nicotianae TaxID=2364882 RepID=UPI000EB4C785|nr:general stress protein [Flavisolibacter nicotianae]